jgi:hypothetical protein
MQLHNVSKIKSLPIPLEIEYKNMIYKGEGIPVTPTCKEAICFELDITLNGKKLGLIHCTDDGWQMDQVKDQGLVDAIGEEIFLWYE